MLDTSNLSKFLKGITDALRAKKGTTEPIEHKLIDEEIASIESGDPYQILQDKFFYSGRKDFSYAFGNSKITDDDISKLVIDTSKGTNFTSMFCNCKNLTKIPPLNTINGTTFKMMFFTCNQIVTISQLDLSLGKELNYLFYNCSSLTTVPKLNIKSATNTGVMFYGCVALKNISFENNCIKISLSFSNSDRLTNESIQSIIDGLAVVTTAQTITFHSTVSDKITDEQIATIYEKGWSLAGYEIINN